MEIEAGASFTGISSQEKCTKRKNRKADRQDAAENLRIMNCREFERTWNNWLDDRGAGGSARTKALEEHAAACSVCQSIHARYLVLTHALRVVGPLPSVPEGFADRVLAAHGQSDVVTIGTIHPAL